MSLHTIPIPQELNRLYKIQVGFDKALKIFFFRVWDAKDATGPINNNLAEYEDINEFTDAINDFLGNVIGKTYKYPFALELLEQLYMEQCLGGSNLVKQW